MNVDGHIKSIEETVGYVFRNKPLCAEALQMKEPHCPLLIDGVLHLVNKNRDLELVGDAVLDEALVKKWYEARDYLGERHNLAAWTQMRTDLVSNEKLAERGFRLGLDKLIIKNLGMRTPSKDMVANTFEAIIGAICMDAGTNSSEAVRRALERMGFFDHPLITGPSDVQPTDDILD
ncbi:hypothetical protein ACET3X_002203 [Alternaria dauci]|uniref:RNase III domain-containing protein n=1 Tax=Alternaria dauci TaxID=48095 RepID=A0ABR3UNX4_9PLEO